MESQKKILFVDDDPNFLAGLFRTLHGMSGDWRMSSAGGADEALESISHNKVDVVVTDFRMVGKDGLDLLKAITESEDMRDIPVVMLTGSDESDLKRRAIELGAADLLGKPVVREDLIARISSVLKLKAYQDELRTMNQRLEAKVRERTAELEQSRLEMIWRLAKAGEYRDEGTGNHVVRVGHYSRIIADQLGADQEFIRCLFITSPLHDIGKIGIPDAILNKRGKLTDEERAIMKRHCEIGAKILAQPQTDKQALWTSSTVTEERTSGENQLVQMAATIALSHHERIDGAGYPAGLAGEDIPMEARIVAVADVYDALSMERPYKPAFPQETVLSMMREQNGLHFSPAVYEAMIASLDQLSEIREQFADQENDEDMEKAA